MNQQERRRFLINYLLKERKGWGENVALEVPEDEEEQKYLLRALLNVRSAEPVSNEFLRVQDEYLQERNLERGITDFNDISETESKEGLWLWRGDITTLKIGAIVNAANSALTGCYQPNHSCIDNCIHTFAGVELRFECASIMRKQGCAEKTGRAKITKAYNLPCDFVIHTVGPIVRTKLSERDCILLESSYKSCLDIASENGIESIAFCCISTGVFSFPAQKAAEIAVKTVRDWKKEKMSEIKVVFNVFSEKDEAIYRRLLSSI